MESERLVCLLENYLGGSLCVLPNLSLLTSICWWTGFSVGLNLGRRSLFFFCAHLTCYLEISLKISGFWSCTLLADCSFVTKRQMSHKTLLASFLFQWTLLICAVGSKFSLDVVFERFGFAVMWLSVSESLEISHDVIHLVSET